MIPHVDQLFHYLGRHSLSLLCEQDAGPTLMDLRRGTSALSVTRVADRPSRRPLRPAGTNRLVVPASTVD